MKKRPLPIIRQGPFGVIELHMVAVEVGVTQGDVVCAAFDNGGCGHKGQTRILLQVFNVHNAAVAHGGADFAQ